MDKTEIIGLIVTILAVGCFSIVFIILYSTYTKSEIGDIKSGKRDIAIIDQDIYDNLSHVKSRRRIMKTIKSIAFYGLMLFIMGIFTLSLVNKFNDDITMFGDRGVIAVASGSMSEKHKENTYLVTENLNNQFDKYDIIVVEKVDSPYDLKLYDVISFVNDEGVTIIHRIVDINYYNEDGEVEFITRGDANADDAVDKFHPTIDDIQGKYVNKRIPLIGMFILFIQSSLGMITIIALAFCLVMIERYSSKILHEQENRLKLLKEYINFDHEYGSKEMFVSHVEKIYYKGSIYLFDENGFVEKLENKEENKTMEVIVDEDNPNENIEASNLEVLEQNDDSDEINESLKEENESDGDLNG